jgi:hypothetical protein
MGTVPAPNIADEAGQIAQMPQNALAEYARIAQLKQQTAGLQQQQQQSAQMAPLQQQAAQQQIEAQKRQFADQDALTKAITQYDPAKHTLADVPKLITQNGGSGQSALQAQQGLIAQRQKLTQLSDEQFAEQQKNADLIAGVHDSVSQAPPEQKQAIYQQGLQRLSQAGVDVSKEPTQYPGDDQFAQHLPSIRLHSAIVAEAEKDRELSTKEQEEQNKEWKDFPALGVALNTQTGEQKSVGGGAAMSPQMMEGKYVALQQKKNSGQVLSKDDAAWSKAYEHMKTLVPVTTLNLQAGLLTPQAKEMAAQLYQQTGTLPSGMRSPAMSAGVLNQAAGAPGTATPNIAANKAGYAADAGSLKSLQKNADQVAAFENTAGKNLDVFLNQAHKVIDSGSPWINQPLRSIDSGALGDADQAAFNAARQTAVTEIAKVLNSSNASGVLSDSARHEVEGLIGPNASLKQIFSAANILKQDMANRHQAYQQQIAEIRGRAGATPSGTQPGGGMIRARDPQGKLHEAPAGTALPQGWKLEQ